MSFRGLFIDYSLVWGQNSCVCFLSTASLIYYPQVGSPIKKQGVPFFVASIDIFGREKRNLCTNEFREFQLCVFKLYSILVSIMLGLRLIFVALLCAGFANADDLMSLNKFGCLNNAMMSEERPQELKIALNLQQNYKVRVVVF